MFISSITSCSRSFQYPECNDIPILGDETYTPLRRPYCDSIKRSPDRRRIWTFSEACSSFHIQITQIQNYPNTNGEKGIKWLNRAQRKTASNQSFLSLTTLSLWLYCFLVYPRIFSVFYLALARSVVPDKGAITFVILHKRHLLIAHCRIWLWV